MYIEKRLEKIERDIAAIAAAITAIAAPPAPAAESKQTKSTREEKPVSPADTPPEQHKNPAEPRYVIDDVRSLLARVSANGGNARQLLKSMGAERLSQLPEAKYGSIIGLASDWLEGNLGENREGAE